MKISVSDNNIISKTSIDKLNDVKNYFDLTDSDVVSVLNFVKLLKDKKKRLLSQSLEVLTEREQEVFKLVITGMKTREIAEVLCISMATVSTHRKKIKHKLAFDDVIDWYNTSSYSNYEKIIS